MSQSPPHNSRRSLRARPVRGASRRNRDARSAGPNWRRLIIAASPANYAPDSRIRSEPSARGAKNPAQCVCFTKRKASAAKRNFLNSKAFGARNQSSWRQGDRKKRPADRYPRLVVLCLMVGVMQGVLRENMRFDRVVLMDVERILFLGVGA